MLSLTYLSSATTTVDEATLQEILRVSRVNNQRVGVTGMLLYADQHFIQTLEGEDAVVEATYARIGADPRHRNVVVALREQVDQRTFPEWSMGFHTASLAELRLLPGFNDFFDPASAGYHDSQRLGRAGDFHRVFRDTMRAPTA